MFWIFVEDFGFEETLLYDKGPLTLLTKHLRHTVSHNPKAKHRWFRQLFVANGNDAVGTYYYQSASL